jgi:electron transfer flavoprotein beta subunit
MKILVCIKQVPGTNKVEVDEKTGVLKREGIESKMNPYDLYAIEVGLMLKEKNGGSVTVVTMGPPQAREIVREAYMLGVDEGFVFSDRKFAGADVLATAYTLSQGIKAIGEFDLIICGKQTTDGDTAQVGPAVAEYLEIPHAAWVSAVEKADNNRIIVEQDLTDSIEVVELMYPCLITVEKNIVQPRLPSYRRKHESTGRPVNMLSFSDFADQDEKNYGLNGSATQVEKIFPPRVNTEQIVWHGNAEILAENAYKVLKAAKLI